LIRDLQLYQAEPFSFLAVDDLQESLGALHHFCIPEEKISEMSLSVEPKKVNTK
jgi:hypothetical protein